MKKWSVRFFLDWAFSFITKRTDVQSVCEWLKRTTFKTTTLCLAHKVHEWRATARIVRHVRDLQVYAPWNSYFNHKNGIPLVKDAGYALT